MTPEYLQSYSQTAKRRLHLGRYNPLPLGGIYSLRELFDASENGLIRFGSVVVGYQQTTDRKFVVKRPSDNLVFPSDTQFLELHFQPERVDVHKGELGAVISILRGAARDMGTISWRMISDPSFLDIDFIGGGTNMTLAKIAVDKLGFSFVNPNDAHKKNGYASIYMTRGEVIGQREHFFAIQERLDQYAQKRRAR